MKQNTNSRGRHPILIQAIIILMGTLILGSPCRAESQPNILFIYLDDFGWKDAGFMGSDFYETPNLDRLAKRGMIFTDAYSDSANCAPARACHLSGQYTPRHGIYNVGQRWLRPGNRYGSAVGLQRNLL